MLLYAHRRIFLACIDLALCYGIREKTTLKSVKEEHPEESDLAGISAVFHAAAVGKLFDKNTVGGHTGVAVLGEAAGLALLLLTWGAKGAATGACHEAGHTAGCHLLFQTEHGGVVGRFRLTDGLLVRVVGNIPEGLQDKGLLSGQNPVAHLGKGAAVRRTGVIHAVLAAEVFGAKFAENLVEGNLLRRDDRGVCKALRVCHFFQFHDGSPLYQFCLYSTIGGPIRQVLRAPCTRRRRSLPQKICAEKILWKCY